MIRVCKPEEHVKNEQEISFFVGDKPEGAEFDVDASILFPKNTKWTTVRSTEDYKKWISHRIKILDVLVAKNYCDIMNTAKKMKVVLISHDIEKANALKEMVEEEIKSRGRVSHWSSPQYNSLFDGERVLRG